MAETTFSINVEAGAKNSGTDRDKMEADRDKITPEGDVQGTDERRYRFLIENSGDVLWTIDLKGRWQFITSNVDKVIHIKAKDILGKTVWDFVAPEYHAILREKLAQRLHGEKIPAYEVKVIDSSGNRIPFEVLTSPILDEKGEIVGIQGISRNLTERKKAEERIRKSEEKFSDLVANIYNWVWEVDANAVFTYSSPLIRDYLNFEPDEATGRSLYDFITPESAEKMKAALDDLAARRSHFATVEIAFVSKQGEPVDVEVAINPVYDEKIELKGFRGICRDIRDRKQAEKAMIKAYEDLETRVEERTRELAQARSTLLGILDTAPIGIIVADAKTKMITFCSPGATKILGRNIEGFEYGLEFADYNVMRPEGSPYPGSAWPLSLSLKSGKHVSADEIMVRLPDGRHIIIMVSSAPIKDQHGQITAAVATIVDITRMKTVENELRQAKSQAELYLDLMSHDINNMSTMAMGYIEMALEARPVDEETGSMLKRSLEMLKNTARLIDNVRKIQLVEAGETPVEMIDLCEVVERVKENYKSMPGKSITINVHAEVSHCFVMAGKLIEDVFANLIENSIKHALPEKPVIVDVSLTKENEDGIDYAVVSVADHGPGIPDEQKSRLFSRLQRGKTRAAGRGLGLYLAKTLVEDYKGKVWVEDRVPGDYSKGTKFVVRLPATGEETNARKGVCTG